jgi:hypothetical protein
LASIDQRLKAGPPPLPQASGLDELTNKSSPTYLLKRGDLYNKGPLVEPGFPVVLVDDSTKPLIEPRKTSTGRREALANWLVSPDNPLTSRVIVNRLWQGHFGRALVENPSDFGLQGDEPTHPELLDWLATELIQQRWSLKAMHRLIVTSAIYRQSSLPNTSSEKLDSENENLWRQNRRRLDGEALRDTILAASGRLNLTRGGPCVFPELPNELMKLSSKGAIWPVSAKETDRNRRSLYVFTRRNLRYPFFEVFDRPDTNASCPRRPASTVAPQALTLLNSKLSQDNADALAGRLKTLTNIADQVEHAYLLTLGRRPTVTESKLAESFIKANSLNDFCLALFNLNEFIYID